jgi:apolipoprotein N-acyltransferase
LLQEKTEQELSAVSEVFRSKLVIWPELPAPLYYYEDREFHESATKIALQHGYFLFGTVAYTAQHQPMNSAVVLGPDGVEVGRYDKIELVPFGEFVPPIFGWVNRITQEAGDFVPGRDIRILPAAGHKLGVFICYESAFPDLVRQFSRKGAGVLVNLSNDAYFGHSEARQQHLLLARMRAVENRRYLIRATNDGITAVISPAGQLVQQLPMYKEVASLMRYSAIQDTSFYARHGDWFAWTCLVAGLAFGLNEMLHGNHRAAKS